MSKRKHTLLTVGVSLFAMASQASGETLQEAWQIATAEDLTKTCPDSVTVLPEIYTTKVLTNAK
jgi:hypothetical protein